MMLSIIVAVSDNHVIGKDNKLIWHMPADMKFFKDKTTGHYIITGRKNYESIPQKYRPLPGRTNIIVTRQKNYSAPGAIVVNTMQDAFSISKSKGETECFIIGGAEIYNQTIDHVDKIYLTKIHNTFEGDTYFPELQNDLWKELSRKDCKPDEKNKYSYSFIELVRK